MKFSNGKELSNPKSLPFNFVLLHMMFVGMKGFVMQILVVMIFMSGKLFFYGQLPGFKL